MKKILLLDNYDSFTYNLAQIIYKLGYYDNLDVIRNDKISLEEVEKYKYILLSPGPGLPQDAGIMNALIQKYYTAKNILGVCLGHQAIGDVFGCQLINLETVFHGVITPIEVVADDLLFVNLPKQFDVCRYHSWVVGKEKLNPVFEITSLSKEGNIMSFKHKNYEVRGVQFHPESYKTQHGEQIINNWLSDF